MSLALLAIPALAKPIPSEDAGACSKLAGLSIPAAQIRLATRGARITRARDVPADPQSGIGEYCKIDGEILSVDPRAQNIKFSIGLPSRWNGRMLQLGGGGMNGAVVQPTSAPGYSLGSKPVPLARGYVVFGSDSGHAGSPVDPSFMLNSEELRNFASDQIGKTYDVARRVILAQYGQPARSSFFIGGSEGGREALAAAQDYPENYNGVIAIYPFMAPVPSLLKAMVMTRAMWAGNGAGWLNNAKLGLLRSSALANCDANDGRADLLIVRPDICRSDLRALRCPNGGDTGPTCLSDAQLRTVAAMQRETRLPYRLANGVSSLPGFPVGADWQIGGFSSDSPTLPPTVQAMGMNHALPQAILRNLLYGDPTADMAKFDPLRPGGKLALLQRMSQLLDKSNPNLDGFVKRRGKLVLIHGLSDIQTNANATVAYYHALLARYGAATANSFVRLYLVPGWGHGKGISFNPTDVPLIETLEAWTDGGRAPDILSAKSAGASPTAILPLCPFPLAVRYTATADFTCRGNR